MLLGIMVMVSDVIKKQACASGVVGSFCKVVNCKKLQFVPKWNKLKSIVLWGFCPNLVKTSEKGGRPQVARLLHHPSWCWSEHCPCPYDRQGC